MRFLCDGTELEFRINQLYVAGWTGRNPDAVQHHIDELAAIGVAPPSRVPLFYRVSSSLLTQQSEIQVLGEETSGEVEPFLIQHDGSLFLGLGSDHTDRKLEAHSVAASKQVCPKPVACEIWRFENVRDRLDELVLRSWIKESGKWVRYQENSLASILPLANLVERSNLSDGSAILCGTVPAINGVRPALDYRMELFNPADDTRIELNYATEPLAVVS